MSQIMYNYPAMLAHSADMAGYAGTLQSLGADISAEQAALQSGWQGDTGLSYQAWQAQWNQALEQLVLSYRAMASTHENNTTSMLARASAEGARWGGCPLGRKPDRADGLTALQVAMRLRRLGQRVAMTHLDGHRTV